MNSKTKNQVLQVLQKALELSQSFCVVFCKGKIPLEKHSNFDPNTPRTSEELFKALQELPTIPDSIAIKIPQNWLILDIDNKEERTFWELFKGYKFDWQETSRGYHIPVIFDGFRDDYEKTPRALKTEPVEGRTGEKPVIEVLKEGELCVIWDINGREWNCENILKIDEEVKRVIFASFRNMHSPKTQASTILEKFKPKREETGQNKLLWEWSTKEELLEFIMRVAGREEDIERAILGKPFKCLFHKEKHPSASFFRGAKGELLYRDWHSKEGHQVYTVAEVYHALKTGELKKLSKVETAKWLEYLIVDYLNSINQLEKIQTPKIKEFQNKVNYLLGLNPKRSFFNQHINIKKQGCIYLYVDKNSGASIKKKDRNELLLRSFLGFILREFYGGVLAGVEEINLSERYIARSLGLQEDEGLKMNKLLNLLCVLGLLEKVGDGARGDKVKIADTPLTEIENRFKTLFPDGIVRLSRINAGYVARKLGEDISRKVFRRAWQEKEREKEKQEFVEVLLKVFKGKFITISNTFQKNKEEPKEKICPVCGSKDFWTSIAGQVICRVCHSPASEKLVSGVLT